MSRGYIGNTLRWLEGKACIQIDVPINPGNSGGPVFDVDGKVIGIATFKAALAEGVGYALFIEKATQGDGILRGLLGEQPVSAAYKAALGKQEYGLVAVGNRGFPGVMVLDTPRWARATASARHCPSRGKARYQRMCGADLLIRVVQIVERGKSVTSSDATLHFLGQSTPPESGPSHAIGRLETWVTLPDHAIGAGLRAAMANIPEAGGKDLIVQFSAMRVKGDEIYNALDRNPSLRPTFVAKIDQAVTEPFHLP